MSFTSIKLDATPVEVLIERFSGSTLAVNGPLSQNAFGVDADGSAYFDTDGPVIGEGAALGWDGSVAKLFLDSRYASDGHLMLLGASPVMGVAQSARAFARSRTAPRPSRAVPVAVGEVDGAWLARAEARVR